MGLGIATTPFAAGMAFTLALAPATSIAPAFARTAALSSLVQATTVHIAPVAFAA
jgi:hypothetical protein